MKEILTQYSEWAVSALSWCTTATQRARTSPNVLVWRVSTAKFHSNTSYKDEFHQFPPAGRPTQNRAAIDGSVADDDLLSQFSNKRINAVEAEVLRHVSVSPLQVLHGPPHQNKRLEKIKGTNGFKSPDEPSAPWRPHSHLCTSERVFDVFLSLLKCF